MYDLIPRLEPQAARPERYKSKVRRTEDAGTLGSRFSSNKRCYGQRHACRHTVEQWADEHTCRSAAGVMRSCHAIRRCEHALLRATVNSLTRDGLANGWHCTHTQHEGKLPIKERPYATMGLPNGYNAEHPATFIRAHTKEPVLPQREQGGGGS